MRLSYLILQLELPLETPSDISQTDILVEGTSHLIDLEDQSIAWDKQCSEVIDVPDLELKLNLERKRQDLKDV